MPGKKCFIGLGANLGNRRETFEKAASAIRAHPAASALRASPIFESPALMPETAPLTWDQPYLNAAIEIEWRESAESLLDFLKQLETNLGRTPSLRWAPRVIDLDLLLFANDSVNTDKLTIPHPELTKRAFVLTPLKFLAPTLVPNFILSQTERRSILEYSRQLEQQIPAWMAIVNLTPDSFSDGGELASHSALSQRFDELQEVQILDLGAESTRPDASVLSPEEEWRRLKPALILCQEKFHERTFRPKISVDTYHPETAALALEFGTDIINDVSGLMQPAMLEILSSASCDYILMHSLSVPADPKRTLTDEDPFCEVKAWAEKKLEALQAAGVALDRVIFDPGLGFGKTTAQSRRLVKHYQDFLTLPARLMIGHSRKSFLNFYHSGPAQERDPETLGISLRLAQQGVDILRVHKAENQQRAFKCFQDLA